MSEQAAISERLATAMHGRWTCLILLCVVQAKMAAASGILFPRASETREVTSLDGIWRFRTSPQDDPDVGFKERWFEDDIKEWIEMPVPASYNDITADAGLRDYVGWVWYQRRFFAPRRWRPEEQRVFLRFGSVHYTARVWLNGASCANHSGGHLPFQGEVSHHLHLGRENLLTVAVNNTLTQHTVPQGAVEHPNDTVRYPPGYVLNTYTFDFFNYAGIHRPVLLYTTPRFNIDDITVHTDVEGTDGLVKFSIVYNASENSIPGTVRCEVTLLTDAAMSTESSVSGCDGKIYVPNAELWWPVYMHANPGHLYTLEVRLYAGVVEDVYRLPIGIRALTWNNATGLQINGKSVYFRGFGKHEDSNIRGKGLDFPLLTRDYNLISWLGANAYRTSHYPYAEEAMDMADRLGIMIIDESPAVNLDNFGSELLSAHKIAMKELLQRDKNRPSVVLWSLANEPRSHKIDAGPYFKEVADYVRLLDPSRPVTYVTNRGVHDDQGAEFMDVIGLNHYSAWYSDAGLVELIPRQVEAEFDAWHVQFGKPIFMSEYGAGSLSGLHALPLSIWTEDYQQELVRQHFDSFDKLRKKGFFIGEMIWNFADFATKQDYTRVLGNRKGLFTRDRQPKMAAHTLRTRYRSLAEIIDKHRWTKETKA